MKYLLVLLLLVSTSFAGEISDADKKASIILDELNTFSQKKLDPKKDQAEVEKVLKKLVELDKLDPSRTGLNMLAGSYGDHEALYKKAAKKIETPKNKKSLKEILGILKNLNQNGNG